MTLSVGTPAPLFTARDDTGHVISLSQFRGRTVVLYFYPKDDTPGCTREAQSFRDIHTEYQNRDITILGVSMDDEISHQRFKKKYGLPFSLIADADGTITDAYDVEGDGYSRRVTYLINGAGVIEQVFTAIKTDTHASDILAGIGVYQFAL